MAINIRKQISSEEQVYERLQTAIKEKNGTELAELLRFASGYERRLAINLRTCEAARLCGYDIPPVNEYGWMEVDDLMVIALRKEIRKLRNLQDGEGSEKMLKQINRLKKKLFRQMRKF